MTEQAPTIVPTSTDDTQLAVRMTIAHVVYNRGFGLSVETCEQVADEIMHAVSSIGML